MKRTIKKKDMQTHEFEKRDLGKDITQSRSAVVVRPKSRQMPTSILLDPAIVSQLKDEDNLLLKPVKAPKLEAFRKLIKASQSYARQVGLKKADITQAIKKARQ